MPTLELAAAAGATALVLRELAAALPQAVVGPAMMPAATAVHTAAGEAAAAAMAVDLLLLATVALPDEVVPKAAVAVVTTLAVVAETAATIGSMEASTAGRAEARAAHMPAKAAVVGGEAAPSDPAVEHAAAQELQGG